MQNSPRQVGQVFGVAVLGAFVYARLPGAAALAAALFSVPAPARTRDHRQAGA